jgi:hypothetical protein
MKPFELKREGLEHLSQYGNKIDFADFATGKHRFILGDLIERIDVVNPLNPVLIALANGINTYVAWLTMRQRLTPFAY